MALDTIGRGFGKKCRVSDHFKSTRYVYGYGSDFLSGIEDLHPLLREQKQNIQGRLTCSESKLKIGNQAIGEEEGFNVWSDDGFHKLFGWLREGLLICSCRHLLLHLLCRVVMFANFQADGRWPWANERVNRSERGWARTHGLSQACRTCWSLGHSLWKINNVFVSFSSLN